MAFKLLSQIDKRTKYSVHGWIRRKEKTLGITNIPSMINAICILYFRDDDIFDVIGDDMKLSANKHKLTKIRDSNPDFNNYGLNEIISSSKMVYKWDLKMHKQSGAVMIGISSSKESVGFGNDPHFVFCNDGSATQDGLGWYSYGQSFQDGDIVSITFDLGNMQTKLTINGKDQPDIRIIQMGGNGIIKYRLYVLLQSVQDCVEIINFSKQ